AMAKPVQVDQPPAPETGPPEGRVDDFEGFYWTHVRPIFQAKCGKCHDKVVTAKPCGKLDLLTLAGVQKGSIDGPVINAKNPMRSSLLQVVADREMPPKGEPQLTDADKIIIERWIRSVYTAPHAPPADNPLKPGLHAQAAAGGQQPGPLSGNTETADAL